MIARSTRGRNDRAMNPHTPQSHTPIYVNGRIVGQVSGSTFRKTIKGSRHMLRKPLAIALDVQSVHDAQRAGASHAEVIDTETGNVYRASLDKVLREGVRFDRGFGRQVFLPLDDWLRPDLGQGEQMTLFAEMAL